MTSVLATVTFVVSAVLATVLLVVSSVLATMTTTVFLVVSSVLTTVTLVVTSVFATVSLMVTSVLTTVTFMVTSVFATVSLVVSSVLTTVFLVVTLVVSLDLEDSLQDNKSLLGSSLDLLDQLLDLTIGLLQTNTFDLQVASTTNLLDLLLDLLVALTSDSLGQVLGDTLDDLDDLSFVSLLGNFESLDDLYNNLGTAVVCLDNSLDEVVSVSLWCVFEIENASLVCTSGELTANLLGSLVGLLGYLLFDWLAVISDRVLIVVSGEESVGLNDGGSGVLEVTAETWLQSVNDSLFQSGNDCQPWECTTRAGDG